MHLVVEEGDRVTWFGLKELTESHEVSILVRACRSHRDAFRDISQS